MARTRTFGELIQWLMDKMNLRERGLEPLVGVSYMTLRNWRLKRVMPPKTRQSNDFARALGYETAAELMESWSAGTDPDLSRLKTLLAANHAARPMKGHVFVEMPESMCSLLQTLLRFDAKAVRVRNDLS